MPIAEQAAAKQFTEDEKAEKAMGEDEKEAKEDAKEDA